MKNIIFPKVNVIFVVLVISLIGLLMVGCANKPTTVPTQTEVSPLTTVTSGEPEATLPPIPTRDIGKAPTSKVALDTPTPASSAPACTAPADLTPGATEGHYYKEGSPETTNLYQTDMPGTKLELSGYVYTTDCKPVAHALLDFWQPDNAGNFDSTGYTLRGRQYTDDSGHYQLVTIVPGPFPDRSEYIHVKVQAPNGPVLTTQLFFPDVATNRFNSAYSPNLLLFVQDTANGQQADFNFIVAP